MCVFLVSLQFPCKANQLIIRLIIFCGLWSQRLTFNRLLAPWVVSCCWQTPVSCWKTPVSCSIVPSIYSLLTCVFWNLCPLFAKFVTLYTRPRIFMDAVLINISKKEIQQFNRQFTDWLSNLFQVPFLLISARLFGIQSLQHNSP